jgi:hypothetical protein
MELRPASVEDRKEGGHWVGDLVSGAGKTGYLVTLLERRSRYAMIRHVPNKEVGNVHREISRLLQRTEVLKTLTLDNGKESAGHQQIAQENQADVYFARPCHSWERGGNENLNGLTRRLHPKGSSFAQFGQQQGAEELARLETLLNAHPRRYLDWKTPQEAMAVLLAQAACAAACPLTLSLTQTHPDQGGRQRRRACHGAPLRGCSEPLPSSLLCSPFPSPCLRTHFGLLFPSLSLLSLLRNPMIVSHPFSFYGSVAMTNWLARYKVQPRRQK